MVKHAAIFADAPLAKEIIQRAYPTATKIELIEHGYDNIVVLVDDTYAIRFPRNEAAYARSKYEKQVLTHLEGIRSVHIPKVLGEHADPPYLITSFVAGRHLSPHDINNMPGDIQKQLGADIARFVYDLHSNFVVDDAQRIRKELKLDTLEQEPWDIYFEKSLLKRTFPNPNQDAVTKTYYKEWRQLASGKMVVVHDDLHTENMLFVDNRLYGVLDFADTNIGTAEQELRQLYRINDTILIAAVDMYSQLSGRKLDVEAIKIWAIMQELGAYSDRLFSNDTSHPAFARAAGNLNMWLETNIWGKEYQA